MSETFQSSATSTDNATSQNSHTVHTEASVMSLASPLAPMDEETVRVDDDSETPCQSVEAETSFYSSHQNKVWYSIEYGVSSEQGSRKTMEDQHKALLADELLTPRGDQAAEIPFFGVYDGHGGTQCAEFLKQNLHSLILKHKDVVYDPERAIKESVLEVERRFLEKCQTERIEAGSTVAIAIIVGEYLVTGNVGDSEIVLCREGTPLLLTTKHNCASNPVELERVKACGGRIFHNRVGHPKFNPQLVSLAVSRAIGDAGFKLEEYTDGKPSGLIADADTMTTRLLPGDDFIIIGCDGLWDVMTYDDAVQYCLELTSKGVRCQSISEQLCTQALQRGSTDNVTALFVSLKSRPRSASVVRPVTADREKKPQQPPLASSSAPDASP